MLDQFAGNHLPFAIGVGGDHQFTGFAQQPFHRLVLAGGLGLDQHLPALGHDRQISQHPALVTRVITVRRCGFQQMADAPGDGDARTKPATIATPRGAEHLSDIFGLRRFFAEKQPHHVVTGSFSMLTSMRSDNAAGKNYLYGYTDQGC